MSGCIAPVTDRYAFCQFKEQSNAKRSGRRRLIHSFSSFLQNRVEIGGEKNKILSVCNSKNIILKVLKVRNVSFIIAE